MNITLITIGLIILVLLITWVGLNIATFKGFFTQSYYLIITPINRQTHAIKRMFCSINLSYKKRDREYNKEKNEIAFKPKKEALKTVLSNETELADFYEITNNIKINNYYDMLKKLRSNIKDTINFRSLKLSTEQVAHLCMIKKGLKECNVELPKNKKPNWNFKTVLPDTVIPYEEWRLLINTNKI